MHVATSLRALQLPSALSVRPTEPPRDLSTHRTSLPQTTYAPQLFPAHFVRVASATYALFAPRCCPRRSPCTLLQPPAVHTRCTFPSASHAHTHALHAHCATLQPHSVPLATPCCTLVRNSIAPLHSSTRCPCAASHSPPRVSRLYHRAASQCAPP